jgi:hypothetical protein
MQSSKEPRFVEIRLSDTYPTADASTHAQRLLRQFVRYSPSALHSIVDALQEAYDENASIRHELEPVIVEIRQKTKSLSQKNRVKVLEAFFGFRLATPQVSLH